MIALRAVMVIHHRTGKCAAGFPAAIFADFPYGYAPGGFRQ